MSAAARREGEPDLPAGDFEVWLREARRAHKHGTDVAVPCGDCRACCTSSLFVHVAPDETGTLARIPVELLFPAPDMPEGHKVMGYDPHGHCPMFRDGDCSIYKDRPRTCREFDCRVFAAAGVEAARPAIAERARRWSFAYADQRGRALHDAVRAAAAHLREHPERFPTGADPANPAHLALRAIEVCEDFLGAEDPHGAKNLHGAEAASRGSGVAPC